MIRFGSGTPKSEIDNGNGRMLLRSETFPNGRFSVEWILSDKDITVRRPKKLESIQYAGISNMEYTVGIQQSSVSIMLRGKTPKKWYSGINVSGVDMFVAYEAYKFILHKCRNELGLPILATIPNYIPEGAERLQSGKAEIEEPDFVATMRARGVTWEPFILNPNPVASFIPPEQKLNSALDELAAQAAAPAPDIPAQIAQLAELHASGVLTTDEFESKKTELLARM